jgi:hypothetical protein
MDQVSIVTVQMVIIATKIATVMILRFPARM